MILDNLDRIQTRIAAAAGRAGRDPGAVDLVAVTKTAPLEDLRTLAASGRIRWVGENRVQDAARRREALGEEGAGLGWRFIGHLQTNKVRPALELFERLDALDSLKLAEAVEKHLLPLGRTVRVLLRVKLADRQTQSGLEPDELGDFMDRLASLRTLKPRGLMTIAPMLEPVEAVRPCFRRMRELLETHFPAGCDRLEGEPPVLSMGMSRDYEVAVEEGATLVRVGGALFEP